MAWVLEFTTVVTLAAHLICMNYASAAPLFGIVAAALERRQGTVGPGATAFGATAFGAWKSRPTESVPGSQTLGLHAIVTLVLGILLGLLVALFMWLAGDRGLFSILRPFSYKLWWGLAELVFYLLCMGTYLWLGRRGRTSAGTSCDTSSGKAFWGRAVLALLAATNLLYHFPPLFAVMARAASDPTAVLQPVGPSEFRALMVQGPVIALTVHFALAALAVVGVFLHWRLVVGLPQGDADSAAPAAATQFARISAAIALGATACQLFVGTWVLLTLNRAAQSRLMGADPLGSLSLATSVLAAFWLMQRLAKATFQSTTRREAAVNWWGLCAIIVVMTWTLHRAEASPAAMQFGSQTHRDGDTPFAHPLRERSSV